MEKNEGIKKDNIFSRFFKRIWLKVRVFCHKFGKKLKSLKKRSWIIIGIVGVLVALGVFLLLRLLIIPTTPERALENIADRYFTEKILTSERRSSSYTLVMKNLKLLDFDTSVFDKYNCSDDSKVIIYVSNPREADTRKITYQTTVDLVDCKN